MSFIKKLYNKHKVLFISCLVALVLFIIILLFFITLLMEGSSNKYGSRLEGIENVKISNDMIDTITDEIISKDGIKDCKIRLQGKIINLIITFNSDVSSSKAKEIAESTLSSFSSEQLDFYNVEYFITREQNGEEDTPYVVTGNKHPLVDHIGWTNNGE